MFPTQQSHKCLAHTPIVRSDNQLSAERVSTKIDFQTSTLGRRHLKLEYKNTVFLRIRPP